MTTKLKTAVAYIRMSTDMQDGSPDQQRQALPALGETHGYRIIKEYYDPGVSGDEVAKRPQFAAMLKDATRGKFDAILCWDQDRFGRFDSITAGAVIHPLREAGVKLVTCAQGVIDWDDFAGRMIYFMQQEGKHTFLRDLSRNVLRGMLANAEKGCFIRSVPPGLCRIFHDASGVEVARVDWDGQFRKSKGWTTTVGISERADVVAAIQWAFETYANSDCSLYTIAKGLESRGVKTRVGTRMMPPVVKSLFQNKKYVGTLVIGRFSKGKFHRIGVEGGVVPAGESRVANANGRREAPIREIPNAHEALIDEATFARVQAKLERRAEYGGRRSGKTYLLSGILRCTACGGPMSGGSYGGKENVYHYYQCNGHTTGKCAGYRMRGDRIEPFIAGILEDAVSKNFDQLRNEVQAATSKMAALGDRDALERRLAELAEKIKRGQRNFLDADPEDVPVLKRLLGELRAERNQLSTELTFFDDDGTMPEALEAEALENLASIRERFATGDTLTMRTALMEFIDVINLEFTGKDRKTRRFVRGEIVFRPFVAWTPI